jgi:chromosome segregation ATPase
MTKWIIRGVVLLLFISIVIFVYQGIKYNLLEKELRQKDAELSELKKENDKLQEEADRVIAESIEEIGDLEEERDAALERVAELEPRVREADLKIERLELEYEELVASGASIEDLHKNALAQIETLKLEVIDVKEQRDEALKAVDFEEAGKKAALKLADQWKQKYESEHRVRMAIEGAYEMSKDQIRILKLRGTLGAVAGGAIGFVGGLLLGK